MIITQYYDYYGYYLVIKQKGKYEANNVGNVNTHKINFFVIYLFAREISEKKTYPFTKEIVENMVN